MCVVSSTRFSKVEGQSRLIDRDYAESALGDFAKIVCSILLSDI